MLIEALTTRKTVTVGEKLIVPYRLAEVRHSRGFGTILGLFSCGRARIEHSQTKMFWVFLRENWVLTFTFHLYLIAPFDITWQESLSPLWVFRFCWKTCQLSPPGCLGKNYFTLKLFKLTFEWDESPLMFVSSCWFLISEYKMREICFLKIFLNRWRLLRVFHPRSQNLLSL